jgi:hypothetical protein
MVTKNVPSPKFDTKNLSAVFRDFKHYKVVTKNGQPYRRIYVKGDLNVINTTASRVLGAGAYTITNYCDEWYYVGLKDIVQKSARGWAAGRPRKTDERDILTMQWTSADYYERRYTDECET